MTKRTVLHSCIIASLLCGSSLTWAVDRDLLRRAENGDAKAMVSVAIGYRESKQYNEAVRWAKLAAEKQNGVGLEVLGGLYFHGQGVAQSLTKACDYFEAAVRKNAGNIANHNFSKCYFEGGGRGTNWQEALKWSLAAARGGYVPAMVDAGYIYRQINNPEQALFWTRQATEAGNALAMVNLGLFYAEGFGVPEDLIASFHWTQLAADKGDPDAKVELDRIFASQMQLAEKGDTDSQYQIGVMLSNGYGTISNQREALTWFQKGCDGKDAYSCVMAGIAYRDGSGVATDLPKAVSYFRKAADSGNTRGMVYLGGLYLSGQGVGKDLAQAFHLYSKAADAKDAEGIVSLGFMYQNGIFVGKNTTKAVQHYRQASALGSSQADINLGVLYLAGKDGVAKDIQLAIKHYRLAGERGNLFGYTYLGDLYLWGTGVPPDAKQAEKYLKLAAERGFGEAKLRLGHLYILANDRTAGCRLVQEAYSAGATGYSSRLLGWCELHGWQGSMNAELGIRLLEEGTKMGDANAAFLLAEQYESGQAVAKNAKQALTYYIQAGNGGDKNAIRRLVRVYEKGELEQQKSPSEATGWRKRL